MHTLGIALVIYLIGITIVVLIKPTVVYNHQQKRYKEFGSGGSKTLFPIWLVSIVFAMVSYMVATLTSTVLDRRSTTPVPSTSATSALSDAHTRAAAETLHAPPVHIPSDTPASFVLNNPHMRSAPTASRIPNSKVWMNAMD